MTLRRPGAHRPSSLLRHQTRIPLDPRIPTLPPLSGPTWTGSWSLVRDRPSVRGGLCSLATLPSISPFIPAPLYTPYFGALRLACRRTSWHEGSKKMRCCSPLPLMHAHAFWCDATHRMSKCISVSEKTRQEHSLEILLGTSIAANTSLDARRHRRAGGPAITWRNITTCAR